MAENMTEDIANKSANGKVVISGETIKKATDEICLANGLSEEFAQDFWERILKDEEIYREYVYYLIHQDFACKVKIGGVSIVDVLIWQIDHFKAQLDTDTTLTKRREVSMVILAFDTFLKMREDPDKILKAMQENTGSDYPGKIGMKVM